MAEMTVDRYSGNNIRKTDNGKKDGDLDAPQVARVLTEEEIEAILAKEGECDGDA